MMSCKEPSYQPITYERNVSTPCCVGATYSRCQSMASPASCRHTSVAALWPDTVASVTPDEKMGSRNSVTLPVSTKPSPKNWLVVTDQPSSVRGSNTKALSPKRLLV